MIQNAVPHLTGHMQSPYSMPKSKWISWSIKNAKQSKNMM